MGHVSKLATIFALCSLLSACVIYTPTAVTYSTVVHNETTSSVVSAPEKIKTIEVSERVVQKKPDNASRSVLSCDKFVLPRDTRKPKVLTRSDLEGPRSIEALDQLLMAKLDEYRTYVDSVHSEIEQAHLKWLESCQQKLPE